MSTKKLGIFNFFYFVTKASVKRSRRYQRHKFHRSVRPPPKARLRLRRCSGQVYTDFEIVKKTVRKQDEIGESGDPEGDIRVEGHRSRGRTGGHIGAEVGFGFLGLRWLE